MEISREEGLTILKLTAIAWDEGLGSGGDDALMRRIIEAYPDLEVPTTVNFMLNKK